MESHYFVSLKKTEEGYSVWVPGLPGCRSQGANEAEDLEQYPRCHSWIPLRRARACLRRWSPGSRIHAL